MAAELLLEDMAARADEDCAIKMSHYMRNQFEFLGLPAAFGKDIAKPYMAEAKKEEGIDWDFVDTLW